MNTQPVTPKVRQLTGTKKKQFFLAPVETVSPRGGWSGGSRTYYEGLNYKTGAKVHFHQGDYFSIPTQRQTLPADTILIETGTFCGKPAYPIINCRLDELVEVRRFLGLVGDL